MNQFKQAFSVLLEQDLKKASMTDEEAMKTTLDDNSSPEDFDIDLDVKETVTNPNDKALRASQDLMNVVSGQNAQMITTLENWITQIDNFVDFLNGNNENSIQTSLANCIPDTIFDKIRIAEAKKISRSAVDLAALAETFRSYKISANDPKYKFS